MKLQRVATITPLLALVGCMQREFNGSTGSDVASYNLLQKSPPWPSRIIAANGDYDDSPCAVTAASATRTLGGKQVTYLPDGAGRRAADWEMLKPMLNSLAPASHLKVSAVSIARVGGVPHYFYMSNGTQNDAFQTWSSSKFIAFAAGASQIRSESGGRVGFDGWTRDVNGGLVPIGDLVSIATIYRDRVRPYNSNNLGTWAQNVSGRPHSTKLIQTWLGRPGETLAGGYSENGSNLGGYFKSANGNEYSTGLSDRGAGANMLSSLTFVEILRRLVLHRELQAADVAAGRNTCSADMGSLSLPCAQWGDVRSILYGASPSKTKYFNDRKVGGMMGGMSSMFHKAVSPGRDTNKIDDASGGRWKVFTKVGWGPDETDFKDTRIHGYACMPRFDASGRALPGGMEFAVSMALNQRDGQGTAKSDEILTQTLNRIVDMLSASSDTGGGGGGGQPPSLGEIACPNGFQLKKVGSEGGRYCESSDGSKVLGPFTDAMKKKCVERGGGSACENQDWSKQLALDARGTGVCPNGSKLDGESGYCIESGNAFGPFPPLLVQKCTAAGGGPACNSARWSREFLLQLMR